jgi:hypothetical protein
MGKKSKKGAFDGDSVYDYLKRDFDPQGYGSLDRMSDEVRNRKANDDFQRYLLTGEKRGPDWNPVTGNLPRNQKKSKVDKLFEAGIPPSQFKYYAEKAGITNVNSKGDIKEIIKAYDADERYQGEPKQERREEPTPSPAAQDFKDKYVDEVIEKTRPEPEFVPQQSIGDVTGGDNSIVSPIAQDNDISIRGNRNTVSQDNSIKQKLDQMRESLRFAY